jgi:signal transduction histidine kinase
VPGNFAEASADRGSDRWIQLDGEVVFAGARKRSLELELVANRNRVPVTVVDGESLFSTNLLHQRVRVKGIREFSRDPEEKKLADIIVPGSEQIEIYSPAQEGAGSYSTNDLLTMAAQVRRLQPAEARAGIPVKIKGVVIYASPSTLVLQDASGGVFIHFIASGWADQPGVGELWELEGRTDPGDFSPVILARKAKFMGRAVLPEPIRPTWDQLMNGSLDAEYVELHGVVTAVSLDQITLLTADGKVTLDRGDDRALPRLPDSSRDGGTLVGSVVRIRGCFTTQWNSQTRQVVPGTFFLYPSVLEVEEPAPPDPFSLPTRKAADLLWFDARASALQRTKLSGQIIYARRGEYFVLDDQKGLRVLNDEPLSLRTGDLVEAVGFPKLGGPAPVLQEARIRKTGRAPLPAPVEVPPAGLLDRSHDSTLVQVTGTLVSDTGHQDERVLELEVGPQRFVARLKSDPRTWTHLETGSSLQLTGVYSSANESQGRASLYPFELLLNNAAGIIVLKQPSWWTVRRAIALAATLAGVLGIAFVWITLLHRKVEERTAQLQEEIEARQVVEQHRAIEQERIRVARDLHDELGAGLTEVGILGALAKNPAVPQEEQKRYLDQLTDSARALVTGLDEIVWAVNPHYDSVGSLATYFSLFAQRFLNLAGIACRLQVAESFPDYPLDSKLRHGIFLAFKEALNNVVRHAGATEAQVKMEVAGNQLVIAIRDNGRGLQAAGAASGQDGLAGMRERLRQLGGECRIASEAGQGTTVEFRLGLNGAPP